MKAATPIAAVIVLAILWLHSLAWPIFNPTSLLDFREQCTKLYLLFNAYWPPSNKQRNDDCST